MKVKKKKVNEQSKNIRRTIKKQKSSKKEKK